MGWVPDDVDLQSAHEGWAAYMAPDGRLSGHSGSAGFYVRRPDADAVAAKAWREGRSPTSEEIDDLIPWAELAGWQAACSCTWTGPSWRRDQTLPGRHDDEEPDDAYLPDGRTVDDLALEAWRAHIEPLEAPGRVRAAAEAYAAARRNLDLAVAEARLQDPPASWAVIGRAASMSRQAARERWSTGASTDDN